EKIDFFQTKSALTPENQWKEYDQKKDFQSHTKVDKNTGNIITRSEAYIYQSLEKIVEYFLDDSNRKILDESFKEGEIRDVYSGKLGVQDRDFSMIQLKAVLNKIVYLLAFSIENEKIPPQPKKCTRAELIIGGWSLQEVEKGKCKCIYITCSDLKGKIPQYIKDQVSKMQTNIAFRLKKVVEGK
ncbi:hypothetical protein IMG5_037130, partial [Ichthyophthirius multifiliis]